MQIDAVKAAYRRYARIYDTVFGPVLQPGRKAVLEQLNLKPGDPHYYPPFDASNVSRLTWSGEFIHQALPSAMPVLGVANVSHGCVGMPPEGAAYIF